MRLSEGDAHVDLHDTAPDFNTRLRSLLQLRLKRIGDVVNANDASSMVVETGDKPPPSEAFQGRMVTEKDGGAGGAGAEDDELYVCLRQAGAYTWVKIV